MPDVDGAGLEAGFVCHGLSFSAGSSSEAPGAPRLGARQRRIIRDRRCGSKLREPPAAGRISASAAFGPASGLRYIRAVMPTAGILVIGNEILSGKVVDTNSPYLCERLRELGVDVERIVTIPDEVQTIAAEVKAMSQRYDYVFTSGGIGPTHDDLTIEGVAAAFRRPVEIDKKLEAMVRSALGEDLGESQLKMAMVPAGAALVDSDDKWFPLVVVDNVYIFPGIPEGLRRKFESACERFRGVPYVLKQVYVKRNESEIVETLNALLVAFPDLILGSYPKIREASYRVLLTLESRDADYVQRALDRLLADLTEAAIHKVE